MGIISGDDALFHPGSLLTGDGHVVAPYDIEQQRDIGVYRSLYAQAGFYNAAASAFTLDYPRLSAVHIVNGMGVALGDSIIGLTAVEALRFLNPALRTVLYRPARAPAYVESLYHMAAGIIGEMRWLPRGLAELAGPEPRIDLGNHLFWPGFAAMPMIDFFLRSLGADPAAVPPGHKANRWLQRLCLPQLPDSWQNNDYVLFCPAASTPLRSIPAVMHKTFVAWLWRRFACPVLGFGPLDSPHYVDIGELSTDTPQFLSWIKHARFVLSSDSAAVHAAAGFDVPSTAIFTSIAPALRVRDYRLCQPIALDVPAVRNMHASARPQDIALLEQAYKNLDVESIAPVGINLPA
ncbi:hypothetical protein [Sodalis sp. dw_96]|uniref:glycosyltransferase family 9 protein n=1 Tax=Sodalis sp. dw_96 TaxID=2719794 RepID=UPI001BD65DB8|nr:hypothetical protein [Sodalis sp. dw_96]